MALLLVILLFLTWVGTASAECAWVLWAHTVDERTRVQYSVEAARSTNKDCLTLVRAMALELKERGFTVTPGVVERGGSEVIGNRGPTMFKYFCLPDTIDPRGPKAGPR